MMKLGEQILEMSVLIQFENLTPHLLSIKNQDILVSILSRLQPAQLGFDSQEGQIFSFCHHIQTDFGAHPACYPTGMGILLQG